MKSELKDLTITDLFQNVVEQYSNQIALRFLDRTITYQELNHITNQIAQNLYELGIRKGDLVAIATSSSILSAYILYSLMKLGSISVMINPILSKRDLNGMFEQTNPKYLICEESFINSRKVKFDNFIIVNEEFIELMAKSNKCFINPEVSSKDTSIIVFSSGTTSFPKAIPLTQFALINSAIDLGKNIKATHDDCFSAILPIYHTFCLIVNLLIPLIYGASVSIPKSKKTYDLIESIVRDKATILSGIPTMFHSIISKENLEDYDLSSLRAGFIGGFYCSFDLFFEVEDKLNMKLLSTLGLSESTGGFTTTSIDDSPIIRSSTVGKPMKNIEVTIQNEGKILPAGKIGEICLKGYLLMDGYWKNPIKTKEIIDSSGWLHTGDLGYLNQDNYLYYVGRKKNVIIRGGENINPQEIEGFVKEFEFVKDCVVVGIPDEHYNEEICACIVLKENENVCFELIHEKLQKELVYFKLPKFYLEFDSFPKTGIGKNCINEIRKKAIERIGDKNERN